MLNTTVTVVINAAVELTASNTETTMALLMCVL